MHIHVCHWHRICIFKNLTIFSNPKEASIQANFVVLYHKSMVISINMDKDF